MKHVLLLFFCFLSFCGYSQIANDSIVSLKTSFKGRHCRGTHGLCSFDDTKSEAETNSKIVYDLINDRILLYIDRTKVTQQEQYHIVRGNIDSTATNTQSYYLMEDDFIIPSHICSQLRLNEKNKIDKGLHPLSISEDLITITFKLE